LEELAVEETGSTATSLHKVWDRSDEGIKRYPISISYKHDLPEAMLHDLETLIEGRDTTFDLRCNWKITRRKFYKRYLYQEKWTTTVAQLLWEFAADVYEVLNPNDECKVDPGRKTSDNHVEPDFHIRQVSSGRYIITLELKNTVVGAYHMPRMVEVSRKRRCPFKTPLPESYKNHLSIIAKVFSIAFYPCRKPLRLAV
jgi:hypothetical protein